MNSPYFAVQSEEPEPVKITETKTLQIEGGDGSHAVISVTRTPGSVTASMAFEAGGHVCAISFGDQETWALQRFFSF